MLVCSSAKADPWLAELLSILKQLRAENRAMTQPLRLGVYRSDYMIHVEDDTTTNSCACTTARPSTPTTNGVEPSSVIGLNHTPLQVEMNTIAASFMGLSTRVAAMHRFMLQRELGLTPAIIDTLMPQNRAVEEIAAGMNVAFQLYKKQQSVQIHATLAVSVACGANHRCACCQILTNSHSAPLRVLLSHTCGATPSARRRICVS